MSNNGARSAGPNAAIEIPKLLTSCIGRIECEFFRQLNEIVEPLVRAGIGSPGPWPTGAVIVETTGRKTGRTLNVPLLATIVGDVVLVSTVRGRLQWLRNVAATPHVWYWMHGAAREATATLLAPELAAAPPTSPFADRLITALMSFAQCFGIGFALLMPVSSRSRETVTSRSRE
jgi:hypothetical protein